MTTSVFTQLARALIAAACWMSLLFLSPAGRAAEYYTAADFAVVPKIDAHIHYRTADPHYLNFAASLNFKLASPNTYRIDNDQFDIARTLKRSHPAQFAFFGTFEVTDYDQPGFVEKTIARIELCMQAGATGIKIWKNIGMELKDSSGRYVMVDDPVFRPIFEYLAKKRIPVMGHLGEPRNCWLPVDQMTVYGDRTYYTKHPKYHMYLHPEMPSYEAQITARDHLLELHPGLGFIAAHLASLEWSVDELARRYDRFPNLTADMSARIGHLAHQALTDPDKVRAFLIKYQTRLLYATDYGLSGKQDSELAAGQAIIHRRWLSHWLFLATDSTAKFAELDNREVKGLQLPKNVIDKIFYQNAARFFAAK